MAIVHRLVILGALTLVALTGCASTQPLTTGPQIVRGRDVPVVDALGWVVGIPEKILLWDHRAKNHNVSPQTEAAVAAYVQREGLTDTKVRINQYNPGDEWKRLRANKRVAPGWRYTFGTLTWLGETILPGRVFGFDKYNPYTDTISIYSDLPAVAIHEAAYAADNHERMLPGTYGFFQGVGPFNMIHEWNATERSLDYVARYGTGAEYYASRRIIHPLAGYRIGGAIGSVFNASTAIALPGAVIGHVTGRVGGSRPDPESGQFVGLTTPPETTTATPSNISLVGYEETAE